MPTLLAGTTTDPLNGVTLTLAAAHPAWSELPTVALNDVIASA